MAQERDKEPGGNRRPSAVPFIPLETGQARRAVSASLDDEHDLVAGTGLELSQTQEDRLLLAGRADRVDDHPILGRLDQGGQIRNQIVKEPTVQDHLEDTIPHPAAVVIQAPGDPRPPRGVGDVVTDQVAQGLALDGRSSVRAR